VTKKARHPSWTTSFLAVVRYELLWNIRKKKLYGVIALAFALTTLQLALRIVLSNIINQPLKADPNFAVNTGTGMGSMGFFLFALVTGMNSISGEFESGTIIPLLTKPVSRTTVFLGKTFAAFLTLLGAFTVLLVYLALGSSAVYGPQDNLHLLPLVLLGMIVSTFVWMTIILAVGAVTKSSMIAALAGVGLFMGLTIAGQIFALFSGQAWVLTYLPGTGASGYAKGIDSSPIPINMTIPTGMQVLTGTDSIGYNLVTCILHPSAEVEFYKIEFKFGTPGGADYVFLYTETLSFIIARALVITTVYILVFSFIAWYALKRAQVTG